MPQDSRFQITANQVTANKGPEEKHRPWYRTDLALANLITAVWLILLACSPAVIYGVWGWLVG